MQANCSCSWRAQNSEVECIILSLFPWGGELDDSLFTSQVTFCFVNLGMPRTQLYSLFLVLASVSLSSVVPFQFHSFLGSHLLLSSSSLSPILRGKRAGLMLISSWWERPLLNHNFQRITALLLELLWSPSHEVTLERLWEVLILLKKKLRNK